MRERSNELTKCGLRHRSIDPAVSLGQVRVVVARAQHHLQRSRATHETRQVLYSACTGDEPEPFFRLTEDSRLSCGKAHITREREFAACTTHASFDLRDGHEPAVTQVAEQQAERGL